jgi:hypothetical protein|tara:strand:+ start:255 stop:638 length:384 start_codon:yes stop_codon:yes gene_type:complete
MKIKYEDIVSQLTSSYYMKEPTFNDFVNILERINQFINNGDDVFDIDLLLDVEGVYEILSLHFQQFTLIKYLMTIVRICELDYEFDESVIFNYRDIQIQLVKLKKIFYSNKVKCQKTQTANATININ